MRRKSLVPLVLLSLLLPGAGCKLETWYVAAVGDSHSDPELSPRRDWIPWTPPLWRTTDFATSGQKCWETIPLALAQSELLRANRTLLIFCGTNDAGRSDWDLEVSAGWIEAGILWAIEERKSVVLVTPPPAFRDYPVFAFVRNQRLEDLRERIFELADQYAVEVADLYGMTNAQPDPESLFVDGLHFGTAGREMMSNAIQLAVHKAQYQVGTQR